jgi:hypothetical protein
MQPRGTGACNQYSTADAVPPAARDGCDEARGGRPGRNKEQKSKRAKEQKSKGQGAKLRVAHRRSCRGGLKFEHAKPCIRNMAGVFETCGERLVGLAERL